MTRVGANRRRFLMNASRANELPRFLLDLLAACPRAGGGVHNWLFKVSRQLHAHRSRDEIVSLLAATVADCGRHVAISEIAAAVDSAKGCAWQPGPGRVGFASPVKVRTWPEVNQRARREIAAGAGLVDLWEASPVRIERNEPRTEEIADVLFPGNPLLCCGATSAAFDTRTREEWRGELSALQLIVPSPMATVEGVTKNGKPSRHTLSNTGPRRFLVCEFDTGTTDEHAATLLHLATRAPLVLAVHSGGKSLHGWFYCAGQPEEKLRRFMEYAVTLGADPATWTRSQFVRMPGGVRDNGNRQTVFFFNPRPVKL
jgi:hypothetical protein